KKSKNKKPRRRLSLGWSSSAWARGTLKNPQSKDPRSQPFEKSL
uniref:Uncharacterized protein n=1 Tax=Loxodonta africana TaxID=9785 RepID=G3U7Y5_LOXAF